MVTNQIYSDDSYIYAATSVDLTVYDITSNEKCAYINNSPGFSTITGNDTRIYLGTTNSGIKFINKTCISGSTSSPMDLVSYLNDLSTPYITSTNINYLHANNDKLAICTELGVDYFKFNTNPEIHSKSFVNNAEKCFMASDSIYYIVYDTNTTTSAIEYSLLSQAIMLCDWVGPTHSYTTGSGVFKEGLQLTDMYITNGTAENGGNTIFCTTSSGVYIIDEDTSEYAIYYTR